MWPGIYLMEILDELPIFTAAQHHAAPIFGNYGLRSPRRDVPRNCSGGCTVPTIFPLINDINVELHAVQRWRWIGSTKNCRFSEMKHIKHDSIILVSFSIVMVFSHLDSLETQDEVQLIQSHVFAKCPFRRPLGPPGSQALRSTAQFWLPASGALEQQRNWKMSVRFRSFSAHAFLKDNRSRRKCVHQVGKASVVLYQIYIFSKRGSVYLTGCMPRITFPEFMCQCNAWNLLDLDVLGMSWVCDDPLAIQILG